MPKQTDEEKKMIVAVQGDMVAATERIVRFRGRPLIMEQTPYPHFVPLHKERFDRIAYPILGGQTRSRMSDAFAYIANTAEDLTPYEDLILFGVELDALEITVDTDLEEAARVRRRVWNMDRLTWDVSEDPNNCVWRSPYAPAAMNPETELGPVPFVLSLAGGDMGRYDDIMQSMAPLVMKQKPDGVIWWVGDGANGKSTLMDALYRLFPGQFSSLTVKRLTDGRDTPSLNGTLANIVKESSEGRIEDTEIYKAIGTHENFRVHKFHSQDDIEINANMHHIFSANNIPTLNDKGHSARRRTFVVPFTQRFESDPTFERRTFTPKMFSHLIFELTRYAVRLRDQGYRYKWSADTVAAKLDYDSEANNAEEYAKELINAGVVAFDSFNPVRMDYDRWCADLGYVPLGIGNMRKALQSAGYERITFRTEIGTSKQYRLRTYDGKNMIPFGLGRPGLFTDSGFRAAERADLEPQTELDVTPTQTDTTTRKSVIKGEW